MRRGQETRAERAPSFLDECLLEEKPRRTLRPAETAEKRPAHNPAVFSAFFAVLGELGGYKEAGALRNYVRFCQNANAFGARTYK
jgi:hypothetical protein